eukprot:Clim_evm15s236 gene=Clim_evmTU15s236
MTDANELDDFPVACSSCLGDTKYLRMQKDHRAKQCAMCKRPYTVHRWRAGGAQRGALRCTEICRTCAKLKNACQVCLRDLVYGLSLTDRDLALGRKDHVPSSDVNREYYVNRMEQTLQHVANEVEHRDVTTIASDEKLKEIAKTVKDIDERPKRKRGNSDEIEESFSRKGSGKKKKTLDPPSDPKITTFFIGNLPDNVTERDLKTAFEPYGHLRYVKVMTKQHACLVSYTSREDAERAASALGPKPDLGTGQGKMLWAKK